MIVKLLTEHHLECLSLKGGCRGSLESTHFKNTTLLEISCTGSNVINSSKGLNYLYLYQLKCKKNTPPPKKKLVKFISPNEGLF